MRIVQFHILMIALKVENVPTNREWWLIYSNRCPYTDYYVDGMLRVLAQEKNIPLKVIKLETREQAQNSPTPANHLSFL